MIYAIAKQLKTGKRMIRRVGLFEYVSYSIGHRKIKLTISMSDPDRKLPAVMDEILRTLNRDFIILALTRKKQVMKKCFRVSSKRSVHTFVR